MHKHFTTALETVTAAGQLGTAIQTLSLCVRPLMIAGLPVETANGSTAGTAGAAGTAATAGTAGTAGAAPAGKLTKAEERAVGRVDRAVYLEYFRCAQHEKAGSHGSLGCARRARMHQSHANRSRCQALRHDNYQTIVCQHKGRCPLFWIELLQGSCLHSLHLSPSVPAQGAEPGLVDGLLQDSCV